MKAGRAGAKVRRAARRRVCRARRRVLLVWQRPGDGLRRAAVGRQPRPAGARLPRQAVRRSSSCRCSCCCSSSGPVLPAVGRGALIAFVGAACANIASAAFWQTGVPDYIVFRNVDVIANVSDVVMVGSARSSSPRSSGDWCAERDCRSCAATLSPSRAQLTPETSLPAVSRRWMRQFIWEAIFSIRSSILSRISVRSRSASSIWVMSPDASVPMA